MNKAQNINHFKQGEHLPPSGKSWLLPLYDPLSKLFGVNKDRKRLIEFAKLQPGHIVLDIGCGTGTLALDLKKEFPNLTITGLDPDKYALDKAKKKTERAGHQIQFDLGSSADLPYADATFDMVFSSYMLHHIDFDQKMDTIQEVCRVLKPGGRLLLLDLEHQSHLAGKFNKHSQSADNNNGMSNATIIQEVLKKGSFSKIEKVLEKQTLFGVIGYYVAYQAA